MRSRSISCRVNSTWPLSFCSVADLRWLKATFDRAARLGAKAVVISLQADMFDPAAVAPCSDDLSTYTPLVRQLADLSVAFGKPMLLLNGDSRVYGTDRPLRRSDQFHRRDPRHQGGAESATHHGGRLDHRTRRMAASDHRHKQARRLQLQQRAILHESEDELPVGFVSTLGWADFLCRLELAWIFPRGQTVGPNSGMTSSHSRVNPTACPPCCTRK